MTEHDTAPSWPTNSRVRTRKDGNVSASQIAILTGLQTQTVIGHLSKHKFYGQPNIRKLGFGWKGRGETYLTPERAALYTREVLLPIMRRRGGRIQTTENFLKGHPFPTEKEEATRDDKIVEAMQTYSGKRVKRTGQPWIRLLRIHANMPDITTSDRRRLWPRVSE